MIDKSGALAAVAISRRDRVLVISSVLGISAVAWLIMFDLGAGMAMMPSLQFIFGLWFVMMVAMMTPSISPTLLMYARILRSQAKRPLARLAIFLAGYLLIWACFSAAAALAQSAIQVMLPNVALLTGLVLVAAGIFQFTALKRGCLAGCRSPQGFFVTGWTEGASGALVMGLKQGAYCLGCCWLLMSILLATGAMNIIWMAFIAIYVLVEKVVPAGEWLSRGAGLVLLGAGAFAVLGIL
jgi:predicted metal-binding membrane protein